MAKDIRIWWKGVYIYGVCRSTLTLVQHAQHFFKFSYATEYALFALSLTLSHTHTHTRSHSTSDTAAHTLTQISTHVCVRTPSLCSCQAWFSSVPSYCPHFLMHFFLGPNHTFFCSSFSIPYGGHGFRLLLRIYLFSFAQSAGRRKKNV